MPDREPHGYSGSLRPTIDHFNFDAYNALNSSSIKSVNGTYGSRWGNPTSIIDPRIFEIGGQIDF